MAAVTEPFPEDSCPICLTELGKVGITVTKCGHTFHSECLDKCTKDACPKCRQPFKTKKVEVRNLEFKYADYNPGRSKRFQHLYRNGEQTVLINGCNLLISSFEQTLYEFERRRNWACLPNEMILLLFQHSNNHEMLKSMDLPVNSGRSSYNKIWYNNRVTDSLIYCYKHYSNLNDLTELLECIIKYHYPGIILERDRVPNICQLIRKHIDEPTLVKFLKQPVIQNQLENPDNVKECRQILADTRTLEIFNRYVPSSCVIM
jgi:hypothetical protein